MADKTISELVSASVVTASDLFVLEQSGTAKKLTGQILENWLVSFADGHGGIQSFSYTPPTPPSLDGTLIMTLADETVYSFTIKNGNGITSISKTGTVGLVDTYTISFTDGTSTTFTVTNGAQGPQGDNWYVYIKYSAVNPTSDADMGDTPDDWMGIYAGISSSAPAHYTDYAWYQIKGATGSTGATGATGNGIASITTSGGGPGVDTVVTITETDGTVTTFNVYNGVDGQGAPSDNNPQPLGVAVSGTDSHYSRADHVHEMPSADDIPTDSVGVSVQDFIDDKAHSVLYITNIACSATTGNFAVRNAPLITEDHVVAELDFADPQNIVMDVTWTTANGSLTLNGKCDTATTCNVVLVKKDN